MAIRFVTRTTRKNGRIIGVGTLHKNDFGQIQPAFWTAAKIFEVQDTNEISSSLNPQTNKMESVNLSPFQFIVQSEDKKKSVEIRAENDQDDSFIRDPYFTDNDLLITLPSCPDETPIDD